MPSKQQIKRKYHKNYKAKRANLESDMPSGGTDSEGKVYFFITDFSILFFSLIDTSTSATPINKRARHSATNTPASNLPTTSKESENETSSDNSDRSENESSSEQSGSNVSIDKGKRRKRKSNKHNGRKRKNVGQQLDSNDESENDSSSDDSDSSLPENEEFPVVMDANSLDRPGKFYLDNTKN